MYVLCFSLLQCCIFRFCSKVAMLLKAGLFSVWKVPLMVADTVNNDVVTCTKGLPTTLPVRFTFILIWQDPSLKQQTEKKLGNS